MKLTPSLRKHLERLERGPVLELAFTASGGRVPSQINALRTAGYIKRVDHPTVMAGRFPADALEITEAGIAALRGASQ